MANIKIFVCCHQPTEIPNHPLLVPTQVGAALADSHFPGFFYDDTDDNISLKNRSYCELTAQYWAWKNINADYYGFFHYRRYLYPDFKVKRPYQIKKKPELALLEKLGYNDFSELIQEYDLIIPIGENMHLSVQEHYAKSSFHYRKDLDLTKQIVQEFFPEYIPALEEYFLGTISYFGNIFIMRKDIFYNYCGWLFSILNEFDKRVDISGYSVQEKRVDGYLAERLLGGYYTKNKHTFRVCELPRIHFEPNFQKIIKAKVINMIAPPSSNIRANIKCLARIYHNQIDKKKLKIGR